MKTRELLNKLIGKRSVPLRLTAKQFNWLESVACESLSNDELGLRRHEASKGAIGAGYRNIADVYTLKNYQNKTVCFKRDFNGSGQVYFAASED